MFDIAIKRISKAANTTTYPTTEIKSPSFEIILDGSNVRFCSEDVPAMLSTTVLNVSFKKFILSFITILYNGMFECFLGGLVSFFVASICNALITLNLVFLGSITSSMYPYFAAT